MKTFAIIPCGGRGSRTGFKTPKQYIKISGKEILVYTLQSFQKNKEIDEIILSAEPEFFGLIQRLKKKYKLNKLSGCVIGGKERQDSVYSALRSLNAVDEDLVIVHDAARPLLTQKVLTDAIRTAKSYGNAVVGIKARDTLLVREQNKYEYPQRENVYYIQTPQIFTYKVLIRAMESAYRRNVQGTDESVIVSDIGEQLHLVEGSLFNFKITNPEDILILRKLLPKL